jgi:hypothetical protein
MNLVINRIPCKGEKIIENPWHQGKDIHWYIIEGEYIVESFCKLAKCKQEVSVQWNKLFVFEIIPVFITKLIMHT